MTSLEPLMERYADGDVRAFDELYTMLRPVVLAAIRRWLSDQARADDASQTTWLKVHASRARYRRGAPVVPWVLTIARNVALDHLRSAASRERPTSEASLEHAAGEIDQAPAWSESDEAEVANAVRVAVDALPESCREVIRMHKLEGRPMSEVARILGIKEGAARVRAHRGYKVLAKILRAMRSR